MKPRSPSTVGPGRFGADRLAIGSAPDRDEHRVERVLRLAVSALEGHMQRVGLGLDASHLGLEQDLVVELADPLGEGRDDVGIGAGHQLIHQFDDR